MEPAQSLLKKVPAADLGKNLKGILDLFKNNPDVSDALLKKFQLPFEVIDEGGKGEKPFLKCRYNRIGADRYRSPWTNKIYPDKTQHTSDDEDLRAFEAQVNEVWDSYKNLYYGHTSVGSAFLQKSSEGGAFQGVFCVHKEDSHGTWDAIHFAHVDEPGSKTCNYRVESSVLMIAKSSEDELPTTMDISSIISKETTKSCKIMMSNLHASHIENLGTLIEANEIDLRSALERVHIPKTQEIMDNILKSEPKRPVQENPLMGLMRNSLVLKKRTSKTN